MSKTKAKQPEPQLEAPDSYIAGAYHEIPTEEGALRVEPGMFVITSEDDDVSVLVEADLAERFPGVAAADLPVWPAPAVEAPSE